MSKRYTLVVVDVQPFFTNDQETLKHVAEEIERARDRNCDIVFVEIPYFSPMDEEGLAPTHSRLTALAKNYSRCKTVYKPMFQQSTTQSAKCLISACLQFGFETRRFRVCGVNTGGWLRTADGDIQKDENEQELKHTGCVFNMVLGLSKLAPQARVKVIEAACKEERGFPVNWDDYPALPSVRVLSPEKENLKKAA